MLSPNWHGIFQLENLEVFLLGHERGNQCLLKQHAVVFSLEILGAINLYLNCLLNLPCTFEHVQRKFQGLQGTVSRTVS